MAGFSGQYQPVTIFSLPRDFIAQGLAPVEACTNNAGSVRESDLDTRLATRIRHAQVASSFEQLGRLNGLRIGIRLS